MNDVCLRCHHVWSRHVLLGLMRICCYPGCLCVVEEPAPPGQQRNHLNRRERRKHRKQRPGRIDLIRALEIQVQAAALRRWDRDRARWEAEPAWRPPEGSARYAKMHKRLFERPFSPPAFFQAKIEDDTGGWQAWPIDRVVEWSQTARGGKQFQLFHDPHAKCARLGLCETEPSAPETP